MRQIARQLHDIVAELEPRLSRITEAEVACRPAPEQWSKKEILGHLIDSAANNHQRFVRAVVHAADRFPAYDQEAWVRIQRYNETPWSRLVAFWTAYNMHLVHVIEGIPREAESCACHIGKPEPVPLGDVVRDYLCHLRHHLKDIVDH
jgi:hypothetical protein